MKRYVPRLLAAYAVSLTLFAAWHGCRASVYWRLLSGGDYVQILANYNAPRHLTAPIDGPAMLFASLEPANLAAAGFVIFPAFLAFAPKKRMSPTNQSHED